MAVAPHSFSSVISNTIGICKKRAAFLLKFSILISLFTYGLPFVAGQIDKSLLGPVAGVTQSFNVFFMAVFSIICSVIGACSQIDPDMKATSAWGIINKRFGSVFLTSLLFILMVVLGCCAFIIPGIFLYIIFSQAVLAVIVSKQSVTSAFGYSKKLVAGNFSLTACILVGVPLILWLLSIPVVMLLSAIGVGLAMISPTLTGIAALAIIVVVPVLTNLLAAFIAIINGALYAALNEGMESPDDNVGIGLSRA